jgi:hypothetical protein
VRSLLERMRIVHRCELTSASLAQSPPPPSSPCLLLQPYCLSRRRPGSPVCQHAFLKTQPDFRVHFAAEHEPLRPCYAATSLARFISTLRHCLPSSRSWRLRRFLHGRRCAAAELAIGMLRFGDVVRCFRSWPRCFASIGLSISWTPSAARNPSSLICATPSPAQFTNAFPSRRDDFLQVFPESRRMF